MTKDLNVIDVPLDVALSQAESYTIKENLAAVVFFFFLQMQEFDIPNPRRCHTADISNGIIH